jgi:Rrf2 family transcriptional regulator, cysteine metabolism repressor
MVELARHHGNGPLLMRAIAESQGLSRKYLHALLSSLRAAGFVRSVRGSGGGYVLVRAPHEIKVSEVVQTLEGAITFADCVRDRGVCERSRTCVGHELWREMSHAVERYLQGITLADLLARQGEIDARPSMYYI